MLGDTVQTRGDFAGARRILEEAIAVSRKAGARVELVDALHYFGGDALALENFQRARALGDECLTIARQVGYPRGIARALRTLGSISYMEGDRETGRLQLQASIAAALDVGDMWEAAQACAFLGHLEADEGDHTASATQLIRTLEIGRQLGDKEIFCTFLEGAAHLAASAGQPQRALRLAGAAAAQRQAIDSVLFPVLGRLIDNWLAPARATLGEPATSSTVAAGRSLSLEQAVAEASGRDPSLGNEVMCKRE